MDKPLLRPSQLESHIPTFWYNILADLPETPPLMIKPNGEPVQPGELSPLFPRALIQQEFEDKRYVEIPEELRRAYMEIGRPTPLLRARRLEEKIGTPARIYYKYEGVLPTGSHKINTALAQAYYNKREGTKRLTTETGAGQWGSALALASAFFDLSLTVYMVRVSYEQKPYRRTLMRIYGAQVIPSPSPYTSAGRTILSKDPDSPGSLGIAISEAVEDAATHEDTKYSLGSVLNHVLLHQTIIGLEALQQMKEIGEYPDYIVGSVGGGSNYAGLAYPFLRDKLKGTSDTAFIAVEPRAAPTMTRGTRTYDYGDTAGLTPLLLMHTIGHKYVPPPIHAGGLRYHGIAPTLSVLLDQGYIQARAYHQTEVFQAAVEFARTEGIVPAPESAHAVKAVIDLALEAKHAGRETVILFNLSGHGLLDLKGYQDFLEGSLEDSEPAAIDLSYLPIQTGRER